MPTRKVLLSKIESLEKDQLKISEILRRIGDLVRCRLFLSDSRDIDWSNLKFIFSRFPRIFYDFYQFLIYSKMGSSQKRKGEDFEIPEAKRKSKELLNAKEAPEKTVS